NEVPNEFWLHLEIPQRVAFIYPAFIRISKGEGR
ncbi:hypothetical protein MBGDF03_00694, partial [Thermoplasmatales archaeon SCGC AB-540-F20]